MRHGEKYESAYRIMGRWAIDLLLFVALIIAGLFALSNCAGTDTPSTGSLSLVIVPGALFAQEFDVDSSDPERWACCFIKNTPQGPEWRCEPETEEVCAQRQESTWSEGLTCDQVPCPPIELGSCCFDCEPGSGGEDTCEDEATEPFCDEAGGRWELNTLCGERLDCQDQCPKPRGSCCYECLPGSGEDDHCDDGVLEAECEQVDGSWLEDVECAERDDCDDFCPEPVGAVCRPHAPPPDAGQGVNQCVDEITLTQCADQFGEDYCATFWQLGETCATINCPDPVPTMPRAAMALLLVFLLAGALTVLHVKFLPTDRPIG